jgi:hypothetical protein
VRFPTGGKVRERIALNRCDSDTDSEPAQHNPSLPRLASDRRKQHFNSLMGTKPICFLKSRLSQSSIPPGSQIFELHSRSKARHRFADGLAALPKAVTQHWDDYAAQKQAWTMLVRLKSGWKKILGTFYLFMLWRYPEHFLLEDSL